MTAADVLAVATVATLGVAWLGWCGDTARPSRRTIATYLTGMGLFALWATAEAIAAGDGWPRFAAACWGAAGFAALGIVASARCMGGES